eukprot:g7191.t1
MSAELAAMATACGLPERLQGYLRSQKVLSAGLMAAMADSYKEVDDLLYEPLKEGVELDGQEWKLQPDEGPVVRAALRFLWQQCRHQVDQGGQAGGAISHPGGAQLPAPGTTAADPASAKAAPPVPREIPPIELQKLLKFYADTEIAGRKRDFPMRALVGAERVMARIWHERWITHQFTPVQLHEILESRCFDSSGSLNNLNKELKAKPQARLAVDDEQNTIVVEEEPQWSPKGLLSLMDALEAIELGWTLCQLGHELDIKEYVGWWRQLFRSRPGKIEQIKAYWLDAGWRVALTMRQGHDFTSASQAIMDDTGALQAALMKDLAIPKAPPRKPPARSTQSKGKGGGKGGVPGPKRQKTQTQQTEGRLSRYIAPGTPTPKPTAKAWIVLSVFDGCGIAHEAADVVLGSRIIWRRISWEIDDACMAISSHRWPDLEQRGDIFQDQQDSLRDRIDEIDPNQECTILLTAAPPCPDFSRIRPDAPGREGPEGQKFDNMLRWFAAPSAIFKERKVLRMIENVIMSRKADLRHFEAEVGVPAIIMDAQDWGLVKRPRVFWTDAGWQQFGETAMGWRIRWTKLYDTDHLTFEFLPDPVASILPPRWKPPKCLEEGKTLPTLTSPAPGPEGRPAPRSVKGKLDSATFHRWELSGRQFAPWHFRQENLFENERGELVTPSILVKERLHHLEDDFTAPARDERERHKILANSWHLGTAILDDGRDLDAELQAVAEEAAELEAQLEAAVQSEMAALEAEAILCAS